MVSISLEVAPQLRANLLALTHLTSVYGQQHQTLHYNMCDQLSYGHKISKILLVGDGSAYVVLKYFHWRVVFAISGSVFLCFFFN